MSVVTGFHGTSATAATSILTTGFRISRHDYDWLGDGVYFFQDSHGRAFRWAKERFVDEPAVLVADIDITGCLDLLDPTSAVEMPVAYDGYLRACRLSGIAPPRQTAGARRLDREVINWFVKDILQPAGRLVTSVRASCREGQPVFPGSALFDLDHIQIAVRELSVISNIRLMEDQRDA